MPQATPLVDVAALDALFEATWPAVAAMLIPAFEHQVAQDLPKLKAAVAAQDNAATHDLAHGLKGAALYLAAAQFAQLLYRLERSGERGDWEGVARWLSEALDCWERTQPALARRQGSGRVT